MRLTAIVGTVASIALIAAFFSPWVRVTEATAMGYERAVNARLADPTRPKPAVPDDWHRLAEDLSRRGRLTGLDVFFWARTAATTAHERREGQAVPDTALGPRFERAILALEILLAALPIGALVLAGYFLRHRFRRVRTPPLILAILLGSLAVSMAAAYRVVEGAIDQETDEAGGLGLLFAAGALLVLAGAFGVRARNWWRVYGGSLATAAAAGALIFGYVMYGAAR
jgi:hypothetical protein